MRWWHALTFLALSFLAPLLVSPEEMGGEVSWLLPLVWFVAATSLCVVTVWMDLGGKRKKENERFWVDDLSKSIWSYRGLQYVTSGLFGAGVGLVVASLASRIELEASHAIPFAIGSGTLLGLFLCRRIFGAGLSEP